MMAAIPPARIAPARDPHLDGSRLNRAWAAITRWAPGVAFVLAFALVQGKLDQWDAQALAADRDREAANARASIEILRNAHRHRVASGCSTLFYLVQGEVGEQLLQASMALDQVRMAEMTARPEARRAP